jgi:hypothetical protein
MLEILLLIWLWNRSGKLAVKKGLSKRNVQFRTILVWLLGEVIGIMIVILSLGENLPALIGVGLGCAFIAYLLYERTILALPDYESK